MNLTLREIEKAAGGEYVGEENKKDTCVTGVSIDSRQIAEGMLYIPMPGARADGHDFIHAAYETGAAAVLSEHTLDGNKKPYILVSSAPQALKDIAEYYRKKCRARVIGITGSAGKTSTKEMIAAVLSEKFCVLKTEGNFNNEIGMPLTLLRIRQEHDVAVIEMGISDFGEMHRLAKCARPDICVITNIGTAHLENLKDRDGILRAKTEIFDFLREDARVVLNGNDDKLAAIEKIPAGDTWIVPDKYYVDEGDGLGHGERDGAGNAGKTMDFAEASGERASDAMGGCAAVATDIKNRALDGMEARLYFADGEALEIREPIPGIHSVYNACAAACVGKILGMSGGEIKRGLENAHTISGRLNIIDTGYIKIIDDCYNANPASMKSSLAVLAGAGGRKAAILGDMKELGENERELHTEVGRFAADKGIDVILTAGELAREIADNAAADVSESFADADEVIKNLGAFIKKGDTVLVKASHSMEFSRIVDALRNMVFTKA